MSSIDENENINLSRSEKETPLIDIQKSLRKYIRIKNRVAVEFLAEILGTFFLVAFGLASVAQFKLQKQADKHAYSFISVNFAFGFGLTCGAVMIGKVSGGHMNPAVSFAFLLTGRMSILRFFIYSIGQFIGAFLGALIVFLVYIDGLKSYEAGMYSADTAGIFANYPNGSLTIIGGFIDQTVGTALLVLVVLALTDPKNSKISDGVGPILVGFTLTAIGLAFGQNCGFAVNPARDFGPRLFSLIAGWPASVTFSAGSYFFWVPVVAPFVGSLIATLIYIVFISAHWTN